MGPFELIDLIGLDVNLTIARSFFAQGGEPERWRPSPIQERLVAEGQLGRKSGQGYYAYGDGIEREADPELEIAAPTLDPGQLARIDPAASEILARLFAQIANEAAFALEESVASPEDMDTAMRLGLNWPLGPLGLAETIGAERAVELLRSWSGRRAPSTPRRLLRPAASGIELREMAADDGDRAAYCVRQHASAIRRPIDAQSRRITQRAAGTSVRPGSTSSSPRRARRSG